MASPSRIALLFGGRSAEHEVSVRSARSVAAALAENGFTVHPVGITKDGTWHAGSWVEALLASGDQPLEVHSEADAGEAPAALLEGCGLVFPVLHGPFGEDGTVQGLLELIGLPYVGAGVTASAVGMDKVLFKDVMRAHGFPITPHRAFLRTHWRSEPGRIVAELEAALAYPLFVKPANMGSSVGISKCDNRAALEEGLAKAARYDRKLIVEEAVPNVREIEVSVLGNDDPAASLAGEVKASRSFYDYAAKYLDEGDHASRLLIPAPLSEEQMADVRRLALDVYRAIDGAGLARVDFLMDDATGTFYVSEINTMPGFTTISLFPQLWEATGRSYTEVVAYLVELALERHAERDAEVMYD